MVNGQSTLECWDQGLDFALLSGTPTTLQPNHHFQVITYEVKYKSYLTLYQLVLKIINFEM
jgi:hypothetical protein